LKCIIAHYSSYTAAISTNTAAAASTLIGLVLFNNHLEHTLKHLWSLINLSKGEPPPPPPPTLAYQVLIYFSSLHVKYGIILAIRTAYRLTFKNAFFGVFIYIKKLKNTVSGMHRHIHCCKPNFYCV